MKETLLVISLFAIYVFVAMVINGNTDEHIKHCGGSNTYCSINYLKSL